MSFSGGAHLITGVAYQVHTMTGLAKPSGPKQISYPSLPLSLGVHDNVTVFPSISLKYSSLGAKGSVGRVGKYINFYTKSLM